MTETWDHLAVVRNAAAKLKRAERARAKAADDLVAAIRDAEASKIRPGAIIEASGLPRATYYRYVRGNDGER